MGLLFNYYLSYITIGFGDIVPHTNGGRIFVIIYSIIGIPFNLFVTTTIGFLFSASLKNIVQRFERRVLDTPSPEHLELKTLVILALMCIAWLSIGAKAAFFMTNWSWIEGFYAVFVKFSTIGYGDYTLDFEKVSRYWEALSWYTNISLALVTGMFDALTQLIDSKKKLEASMTESDTLEMDDVPC